MPGEEVRSVIVGRARKAHGHDACFEFLDPAQWQNPFLLVTIHRLHLCSKACFLKIWSEFLVGLNLAFLKKIIYLFDSERDHK